VNSQQFESVVREVMADLPEWVHAALDNIEVLVVDHPDGIADAAWDDLLGLYTGTPLPERGADYAGELPDVIYLFRCPHLDLGLPADDLRAEIAKTLIHEIAHYFGIDDEHLDEIGWG